MLSENDILNNKCEYINLLKSVNREGIDGLILYLENESDFFESPASTHYHGAYRGGLCEHSLAVYRNLVKLTNTFNVNYDPDTFILVALMHDFAKIGFYEEYDRNVKVNGQWVQEKNYRVRDLKDRFVFGSHEQTSLFIAQQFVPLSIEEQVAILSHHGGLGQDNMTSNTISNVYGKYTLPIYLHMADLIDAFDNEKRN